MSYEKVSGRSPKVAEAQSSDLYAAKHNLFSKQFSLLASCCLRKGGVHFTTSPEPIQNYAKINLPMQI